MSSFYRKQLEEWLSALEVRADAVLDVGGSQLPVKSRVKLFQARSYRLLDLSQPHKGERPDICFDLNENGEGDLPYQEFDMVFCLEVMEYIYNPVIAIENLSHMTKRGGTLYITFPFVYPQHEPIQDDYLRYTRKGAEQLLEFAGFGVDYVWPRVTKESGGLSRFYSQEGMRASKSGVNHEEVGYIIKAIKK